MKFKGKVVIVTGGGRGIGRVIALLFAEEGANVVIAARTKAEIELVSSEIELKGSRSLAIRTDVTKIQEVNDCVAATVKKFDRIDILVNCAGNQYVSYVMQSDEKKWKIDFETNVFGTYYFCKAVLQVMISQKFGRIINVASRMAKTPIALFSSYCASKAAIIAFTKSLALEVATYNITVNAICPALVETKMLDQGIRAVSNINNSDFNIMKAELKESIPIKRFITPEECARLVLFISSDDTNGITGQAINITGGLEMH